MPAAQALDRPVPAGQRAAVFLDKDGTLIEDQPGNTDTSRIRLTDGAGEALRLMAARGFALVVVSNQQGIARGKLTVDDLDRARARIGALLQMHGVTLDGFHFCPHWPWSCRARWAFACRCRKPAPGLLLDAATRHGLALAHSWMVGDILDDIEAGRRAGCRTILIDNGNETRWECGPLRHPHRLARSLAEAAAIIARDARPGTRAYA